MRHAHKLLVLFVVAPLTFYAAVECYSTEIAFHVFGAAKMARGTCSDFLCYWHTVGGARAGYCTIRIPQVATYGHRNIFNI